MKRAILIYLLFFIAQAVGSLVCMYLFPDIAKNATALGLSILLTDTIIFVAMFSFFAKELKRALTIKPLLIAWALAATLPALFLSNFIIELFGASDGGTQAMFGMMKESVLAILGMSIVGPIAEELIFRFGIQGALLKAKLPPSAAIFLSAFLFGLVHLNPAQIIGASLLGMLFGWFYYRTGCILITIFAHVLNNSLGVALMFVGSGNETIIDTLGLQGGISLAVFSLALVALFVYKFSQQCKIEKYGTPS